MTIRPACIFTLSLVLPGLSGCEPFRYGVDVLNHGENGVILLQVGTLKAVGPHPAYASIGVNTPMIAARFPSLPSRHRDPASSFGRFEGYERSLPDSIDLTWQLASLNDCKAAIRIKADSESAKKELAGRSYGRSEYFGKSGCTWRPLSDRIFKQTVDMRDLRRSDAYKRTGERYKEVAGSRYTLNITLIFIEDQVKVEVDNGATNPWL
jgi:hypothetical protein